MQLQPAGGTKGYLPFRADIEGLRAIAILLVVSQHVGIPGFSGGYIGVDIFFVLSGYLITLLLLNEIETTGKLNLIAFYARRARRLLPALTFLLVVTVGIGFTLYAPFEQRLLAPTAFATAAYVSNIFFAVFGTDYFDVSIKTNPFLHTWSLGVEEQFYLAWPLLMMVALGITRWQRGIIHVKRFLFAMIGVFVASLGLSIWLTEYKPAWAFFSSPTRAWEFALGGLGVVLFRLVSLRSFRNKQSHLLKHSATAVRVLRTLSWIGLTGIFVANTIFNETTHFPGLAALLPALSTITILIVGATEHDSGVTKFLSIKPLQVIGRLSYSWYLWHWPVLAFGLVLDSTMGLPGRIGLGVGSLIIAEISYRLVEKPIRHNRALVHRRSYSMAMAAALTCIGLVIAFAWSLSAKHFEASPGQLPFTRAKGERPLLYKENCMADVGEAGVKECVFGDKGSNTTVALFGDSHITGWFPSIQAIAQEQGWRVITFGKSACPAADLENIDDPTIRRDSKECTSWRHAAMESMSKLHPLVIFLVSNSTYQVTPADWLTGIDRTVKALSATGNYMVQLRDWPAPTFNVPVCLARSNWHLRWFSEMSNCDFERKPSLREDVYSSQKYAATKYANVYSLDLTSFFCPNPICEVERDGNLMFSDETHLTTSFATSMIPTFRSKIENVVNDLRVSK